jgi:hypothetical protein
MIVVMLSLAVFKMNPGICLDRCYVMFIIFGWQSGEYLFASSIESCGDG